MQKKTVKRKIFTSNANKERQSATSIERDSEKGSEINIEEKDDNSMEKDVDRDSEGLVRDSDDSDSSHKTTPQKGKKIHSVLLTSKNITKDQSATCQELAIVINLKM